MTKQSLPNESTFFLNFNKESIKPMIDAIIAKYEIEAEELEYLTTKAVNVRVRSNLILAARTFSVSLYLCTRSVSKF